MTREEMIRLLVADCLDHGQDICRYLQLQKMLEFGFAGFRNMPDDELHHEVKRLEQRSPGQDDWASHDASWNDVDPDAVLTILAGIRG